MNAENYWDGGIDTDEEFLQLRDFFENGPDLFLSLNVASNSIQYCNSTTVRKLGYKRKEELIGQHYLFLYHECNYDQMDELFREFCETGTIVDKQVWLKRRDGQPISARLSSTAIRNDTGVIVGSRSVMRNVPSENNEAIDNGGLLSKNNNLFEEFVEIRQLLQQLVGDERCVFDGIVQGKLNKQIARQLDLSERTIERLRSRLVRKLEINSSAELIAMASRFELLEKLFSEYLI